MKLGRVAKLCKDCRNITVVNTESGSARQWVGTAWALYPFYDLPIIDSKSAFVVFDVDEKKRPDYLYKEIAETQAIFCLEEHDITERSIKPEQYNLCFAGRVYIPFYTSKGIRLVERAFITPMMSKVDELMYFERKTASGWLYIVAKHGLLLAGVIAPEGQSKDDYSLDKFSQTLFDGVAVARRCMDEDEQRRGEPEVVLVDRATGEVVGDDPDDDGGDAA